MWRLEYRAQDRAIRHLTFHITQIRHFVINKDTLRSIQQNCRTYNGDSLISYFEKFLNYNQWKVWLWSQWVRPMCSLLSILVTTCMVEWFSRKQNYEFHFSQSINSNCSWWFCQKLYWINEMKWWKHSKAATFIHISGKFRCWMIIKLKLFQD